MLQCLSSNNKGKSLCDNFPMSLPLSDNLYYPFLYQMWNCHFFRIHNHFMNQPQYAIHRWGHIIRTCSYVSHRRNKQTNERILFPMSHKLRLCKSPMKKLCIPYYYACSLFRGKYNINDNLLCMSSSRSRKHIINDNLLWMSSSCSSKHIINDKQLSIFFLKKYILSFIYKFTH